MTTLPQTSPVRFNKPSNGHLAIPAAGVVNAPSLGGMPGGPSGAPQLTPADAWRIIRSHIWLIGAMVVASAVIGFFVNRFLASYYPSYTATGFARVYTLGELTNGGEPAPAQLEVEQRTQASVMMSDALWLEVLRNPQSKIRQTSWFSSFKTIEEAKRDLEENFAVTPLTSSRLLKVSMRYSVPADSKTIVEEILGQHIRNQKAYASNILLDRSKPLDQQVEKYETELASLQTRLREKSKSIGDDATGVSLVQVEVSRMMDERFRMESVQASAMRELESLDQLAQTGQDPPELFARIEGSPTLNSLRLQISQAETQIFEAEKEWGKDHPKVMTMIRQREALDRRFADVREELKASVVNALYNEHRSKAEAAGQRVTALKELIATQQKELQRIQATRIEMAALEVQSNITRMALEKVNQELTSLRSKIYVGNASTIEWATNPQTPTFPTFPKLPVTMAMAIFLGLGLALGIAFLREITDTTVRSPRDIARVGQINLLGMVPHQDDDPQSSGARLPMAIFDAPQSAIAEQFRQIRTRLQHAASLDTTRSILITSASAGDGKTTIAANLAAGLALNGRRILLVDANFRRPELHRLFEVGNDRGLSDVLNSLDGFDGATHETQVPNLSVLTTGPRPVNPTELLESQLLIDFIERALEEYDHVIFDSGPLPLVSETIALAPRVDGVVTVVRARTNSRGLLQRVRDELRKVKAENLGVILNGVRAQVGGYYGRNIQDYYKYQITE